ncbi:protease [Achromobacter xylosoxidans]|uniref:protease n=1 Tax=Alcaligenes xylosoxydans xylosoxydans TaxID=85698 RepID=UPI001EEEC2B0|nr:protease [Achromobacter xylosoxidans]
MTTETLVTTGQTPTDPGTQQTAATDAGGASKPDASTQTATEQQVQTDAQDGQGGDAAAERAKASQPGDAKAETDAAKDKTSKEDTAKEGAPEQYEDFQAPEGVQLDAELTGDLKSIAKELNLSQKDAQRVADLGPKLMQKWQDQQAQAISQLREEWASTAKADKEYGGDALAENLAVAKQALDTFGTPELRSLLNESGTGNHPELIRFMVRVGKAISSDTFVAGDRGGQPAKRDLANNLYRKQ